MKVLLFIIVFVFLNAKTMTAEYYAKYGWFGTIAEARGYYENNSTHYKITTDTKAKGIAASLSKHLEQHYESTGIVKNGKLVPQKYITVIKRGGNEYKRVYEFDSENKTVKKHYYTNNKYEKTIILNYYATDDILSLYFNMPYYFRQNPNKKLYTFHAVGGRKSDGRIDVTFPENEELEDLKDEFGNKKGLYIKANLYNKVFAGDKGVLYLVIEPNNWVTIKGMVKNVLKIGDLKGGIKNFKLIP